jgi:hypothetical protein
LSVDINLKKNLAILNFILTEYSQGLILPTVNKDPLVNKCPTVPVGASPTKPANESSSTSSSKNLDACKIQTKKLQITEEFKCRAHELYQIFTDSNVSMLK